MKFAYAIKSLNKSTIRSTIQCSSQCFVGVEEQREFMELSSGDEGEYSSEPLHFDTTYGSISFSFARILRCCFNQADEPSEQALRMIKERDHKGKITSAHNCICISSDDFCNSLSRQVVFF